MLGSFIGDIVGSIYEFNNIKTKDFPFYGKPHDPLFFTDDSVMTAATADWILNGGNIGERIYPPAPGQPSPTPAIPLKALLNTLTFLGITTFSIARIP